MCVQGQIRGFRPELLSVLQIGHYLGGLGLLAQEAEGAGVTVRSGYGMWKNFPIGLI
jgi:hypothetical protein